MANNNVKISKNGDYIMIDENSKYRKEMGAYTTMQTFKDYGSNTKPP